MEVYLVDGTYELFRHFFALPSHQADGREVAATRGVLGSLLSMLESGVSHLGVATDHVIESFRNDLWPGYKSSAGVDARLLQQFPLLEEGIAALGVALWPMLELEADDAMAAVAAQAEAWAEVSRVLVCSPDKDLAQCVRGERVVLLDRRSGKITDAAGVVDKFGVAPESIPDYLALVGDSADGYPGLPGWGQRSAATVLQRYGHLEAIPLSASDWELSLRGADKLALTLREQQERVHLFRDLATLRRHSPVLKSEADLRWQGPERVFEAYARSIDAPRLFERAVAAAKRTPG